VVFYQKTTYLLEDNMNLSAPKNVTFYVAAVLGIIGLIAAIIPLGFLSGLSFWLVLVAFLILGAGVLLPNL
jgi:hypothetical protein